MKKISNLIYRILKLVFPPNCVICDKEGSLLCNSCSKKLLRHDLECHICHKVCTYEYIKENKSLVCKECSKRTNLKGVFIAYIYDKSIKIIIEFCKYQGYFYILKDITKLLKFRFKLIKELLPIKDTILVPVPMFFLKQNIRGFNQAEKLCEYINKIYRYNFIKLIKKIRPTKRQVGRGQLDRIQSQKGVFRIDKNKLKELKNINNIIIVDDIMTTGTTLEECTSVIRLSLPEINIYALVIARGDSDFNKLN